MTTLELAELVIWRCFDKVEPATKVTLNCYLYLTITVKDFYKIYEYNYDI